MACRDASRQALKGKEPHERQSGTAQRARRTGADGSTRDAQAARLLRHTFALREEDAEAHANCVTPPREPKSGDRFPDGAFCASRTGLSQQGRLDPDDQVTFSLARRWVFDRLIAYHASQPSGEAQVGR